MFPNGIKYQVRLGHLFTGTNEAERKHIDNVFNSTQELEVITGKRSERMRPSLERAFVIEQL